MTIASCDRRACNGSVVMQLMPHKVKAAKTEPCPSVAQHCNKCDQAGRRHISTECTGLTADRSLMSKPFSMATSSRLPASRRREKCGSCVSRASRIRSASCTWHSHGMKCCGHMTCTGYHMLWLHLALHLLGRVGRLLCPSSHSCLPTPKRPCCVG